jgi:hypothetical protein
VLFHHLAVDLMFVYVIICIDMDMSVSRPYYEAVSREKLLVKYKH